MQHSDESLAEFEALISASLNRRAEQATSVDIPAFTSPTSTRTDTERPDANRMHELSDDDRSKKLSRTVVAVGVAAALVTTAVWLLPGRTDSANVVVADHEQSGDSVNLQQFLPTWMPEDLNAPRTLTHIEAEMPELPGGFVAPYRVFRWEGPTTGDNGAHVVSVRTFIRVAPLPNEIMTRPGDTGERTKIGGREAIVVRTSDSAIDVSVELRPGVTLSMWTRSQHIALSDLAPLIDATDPITGAVDGDLLPAAWSEIPNIGPIAALATGELSPLGAAATSVAFDATDTKEQRSAWYHTIVHATPGGTLKYVEALAGGRWLSGPSDGASGVLMFETPETDVDPGRISVLWALDNQHLGYLFGVNITVDEAIRIATSVEPATHAEWSALVAEIGLETPAAVTAELEQSMADIGDSGTLGEYRWRVATVRPDASDVPTAVEGSESDDWLAMVRIEAPEGDIAYSPVFAVTRGSGMGYGRDALVVLPTASTPAEVTDHVISYRGEPLPTAVVRLNATQPAFAFAILPARETPDIADGDLRLTASYPDGTSYDSGDPLGLNRPGTADTPS